MSLCLQEEEAKHLSRAVIGQVMESQRGKLLNGRRETAEFYVPVCQECHAGFKGGPAHASSAAAAAEDDAEDEDNEDEVIMLRAIAESREYFDASQAKAASLAELAVGNPETGHLDGVGDAEAAEVAAAIRLSQVEY